MITQDILKSKFSYDTETGVFTRLFSCKGCKYGSIAGTTNKQGYISIRIDNKPYYAHRLAWLYVKGIMPSNIDHLDGNPSNNILSNLRESSQSINMRNRKLGSNNKSGEIGIDFLEKNKKYRVMVANKYIGIFASIYDAIKARDLAHKKNGFTKRHGEKNENK